MEFIKNLSLLNRMALFLIAGLTSVIIWLQMYFWNTDDEYGFGYLVPIFVLYVIYDRWTLICERYAEAGEGVSGRVGGLLLSFMSFGGILLGLLFILSGLIRRFSDGPTEVDAVIATMGYVMFLFSFIYILSDEDKNGGARSVKQRLKILVIFLFPILIWLVSVPLANFMHKQVTLFLLTRVIHVVVFIFDVLGIALEQSGNVLSFENGDSVGVEDACSGIRSLTACIFAGSFLAAVFIDKLWKKAFYILLAVLFSFLTNIGRSLFLTVWAYNHGSKSLDDVAFNIFGSAVSVHDLAGNAVMVLTIASLLCFLPIFLISAKPPGAE